MPESSTTRSRLEHLRAASDLTIPELAAKANLAPETIRRLEKGLAPRPRLRTLYRLAGALGVGIDDLFDEEQAS
jgi:transcriptional regulator with XRE-family HTH domain